MSGRLREEIKQTKPMAPETEALLNLQRTADQVTRAAAEAMKPFDISPTQYNALRILLGAGKNGLACSEIGERMVTRDPDITRLLDRLEKRELIQRARSEFDRRVVHTRITPKGSKIVGEMMPKLAELEKELIGHLGGKKLSALIDLLEEVRAGQRK